MVRLNKPEEQGNIYCIFQRLYRLRNPTEEAYCENEKLTSTDIKPLLVTTVDSQVSTDFY